MNKALRINLLLLILMGAMAWHVGVPVGAIICGLGAVAASVFIVLKRGKA